MRREVRIIDGAEHGTYAAYAGHPGCRCYPCRRAKADYMRARRRTAREETSDLAPIGRHGTRYGYEEAGCRCPECTSARMASIDRPELSWLTDRTLA